MKSRSRRAGLEFAAVCLIAIVCTSACANDSSDRSRQLSGPILELHGSSDSPETSFSSVRAALRLDDGRLVIADAGSRSLKLFDVDGAFIRRLGDASSEILAVRAIWPTDGDTVVVYDERRQVVLEVPLDGSGARTWSIQSARLNARAIGRLNSGQVVLRTLEFDPPDSGFDTTMVAITMHAADLGVDTLGLWPSSRMGRVGEPPFQLVTDALFEPRLAAAAAGDRVIIAECRSPEFRSIKPQTGAEELVNWSAEVAEVTAEDMQQYLHIVFEGVSGEERQQLSRMIDSTPVSATLPVCDQVRVDVSGQTWIRSFVAPGATQQKWRVFNLAAELVFTVDFPAATIVVGVGPQHITAIELEPSGQQRVLVYALE